MTEDVLISHLKIDESQIESDLEKIDDEVVDVDVYSAVFYGKRMDKIGMHLYGYRLNDTSV